MSSSTTNIYLLRHGLPEGDQCLRGRTDFEITEHGLEQMRQATNVVEVDTVVSSPLKRCYEFAVQYTNDNNVSLEINRDIAEMDFGDWDGRPFSELFNSHDSQIMRFFKTPYRVSPPNGETMSAFNQRVTTAFKSLCNQYQGKNVLVVSHAGVIREILQFVLGVEPKNGQFHQSIQLSYASLIRICAINEDEQWFFRLHI